MPLVHPAYCLLQIMYRSSGVYNLLILLELIVRHLVLNLGIVRCINKLRVEHLIVKCIHSINPLFFILSYTPSRWRMSFSHSPLCLKTLNRGMEYYFPERSLTDASVNHVWGCNIWLPYEEANICFCRISPQLLLLKFEFYATMLLFYLKYL